MKLASERLGHHHSPDISKPLPLRLQVLPDMEILPIGGTRKAATLAEDLTAIDCQDVCLPTASGPSTTTCITAPSSRVNLHTHVCHICDVLAISKKLYLSELPQQM
jgi:hypothetical protein